jgi:hypothetical protein
LGVRTRKHPGFKSNPQHSHRKVLKTLAVQIAYFPHRKCCIPAGLFKTQTEVEKPWIATE